MIYSIDLSDDATDDDTKSRQYQKTWIGWAMKDFKVCWKYF